jgi:hypothetical protein
MQREPPTACSPSLVLSRRGLQEGLALVLGGALLGLPSSALGLDAKEADDFYRQWPFSRPQDVLPYIYGTAKKGDIDSIAAALDKFGEYYPNYRLGANKGQILEEHLAALPRKPKVALEVGTFWGYSAIRTARHLADGGASWSTLVDWK